MSSPRPLRSRASLGRATFDLRLSRVREALRLHHGGKAAGAEVARRQGSTAAALAALGAADGPDAWLARKIGISSDLLDFMWTAVSVEADPLAQSLAGPLARRGASLSLHVSAFGLDETRAQRLAAELEAHRGAGPARFLVPAGDGEVLPSLPFTVPRRVRSFLAGEDAVEPLVERFGQVRAGEAGAILDADQIEAERVLLEALEEEDGGQLAIVEGPEGLGRAAAVTRAAGALGRPVVELNLGRWDERLAPLDEVLAAWWRECVLRDALGLLSHLDAVGGEAERRRLGSLIDLVPGPLAATARARVELATRRTVIRVAYPVPETVTRRALWRRVAGTVGVDVELLARRYRTGAAGIARATRAARMSGGGAPPTTSTLLGGMRATIADRLGDAAVPIAVKESWDDLVLPEDTLAQVRGLVARVRHAHVVYDEWGFGRSAARGQGVAAILSGPPGTGKTMVAGLVARELELDLLLVDLSRVVSKWIGETEKQLGQLFDAAEAGHALLLFDEADALFGRRTSDVKGAVDRYANLEVSYLLARIESFGGVTILTTNLETAIDPAVKRRLAAHIVFEPPDEAERERLWRRMIPPAAPVAGPIDHRGLALAFPTLTGAHIRNAAIAAAFTAAASGGALNQEVLLGAARTEYQAMGRVISFGRGA